MKTRISAHWLLVPALLTGLLFNGLGRAQTNPSLAIKSGTNQAPAATLPSSTAAEPDAAAVESVSPDKQATKPPLSPWANELAKLAQAGIGDDVMLAYIDSVGTFNLGPDQIVYLRNLGVSNDAINAALQHDAEIVSGQRQVAATTVPSSGAFPKAFLAKPLAPGPSTANSSFASAAPARDEDSIVTELPDLDDSTIATMLPDRTWPGLFTWLAQTAYAPPRKAKTYPVRAPQPVELTQPIIVLNAAGRTPNLLVIEGLP